MNATSSTSSGFDVVLGNPPWERVKLQEQEFFSSRDPEIAGAPNAAARKKAIAALRHSNPELLNEFREASRRAEGESHLMRNSGRYPLCGRGDINTYAVFAETARDAIASAGRVGIIVPTGIATDDTTKFFFQDLLSTCSLTSLFDFENRNIFPSVHSSYKFCLLTLQSSDSTTTTLAQFAFFCHSVADSTEPARQMSISSNDIAILNPVSRTCPVFRSSRDFELTRRIHLSGVHVEGTAWGGYYIRLIHLGDHAESVYFSHFLEEDDPHDCLAPVYEAKLFHHYNHRFSTFADVVVESAKRGVARDVSKEELADPLFKIFPRYFVEKGLFEKILAKYDCDSPWLIGYRDICRSTDERTCICAIIPRQATTVSVPCIGIAQPSHTSELVANLSSFCLDYAARQKVPGTHLSWGIFKQLPILPPDLYREQCPWLNLVMTEGWIAPRVLELTYTATDLTGFARDLAYDGSPFRWDETRRAQLRAELDAAFFHLYGIERNDVDYIMDTFTVFKKRDEQANDGVYKTKQTILDIYDQMARAIETGEPWVSPLDPPPGPPADADGNFIPMAQWDRNNWPAHIHLPRDGAS